MSSEDRQEQTSTQSDQSSTINSNSAFRKRSSSSHHYSELEPPQTKLRMEETNEESFSQSSKMTLEHMQLDERALYPDPEPEIKWTSAFSTSKSRLGFNSSVASGIRMKQRLVGDTVERNRFEYVRPLDGHESCVNALAFSPGQGRYLASGGDDRRVHIRDVLADIDSGEARPLIHLVGHQSNIFSLSWSCDGERLFSGGNDDKVLCYDVSQSSLPSSPPLFSNNESLSQKTFLARTSKRSHTGPDRGFPTPRRQPLLPTSITTHSDSVKEVSAHPTNSSLVMSCSDSGDIFLTDFRASKSPIGKTVGQREARASFSSSLFCPNKSDGNTFAASTASAINGTVCLYDLRTFFSSSNQPIQRSEALVEYASVLQNYQPSKTELLSTKAEVSSLAWDVEGKMFCTSVSLFKPTIYSIGDPLPLAVLSTSSQSPHFSTSPKESVQPTTGGYHSSCTIKHGSFARWGDEIFYAAGSDDFRGYGWKIPEAETLKEMREVKEWRELLMSTIDGGRDDIREFQAFCRLALRAICRFRSGSKFAETSFSPIFYVLRIDYVHHSNGSRTYPQHQMQHFYSVLPTEISTPHFTLEGSKSITNSVQCHPTLPFIATSGVERLVRIYSCVPFGKGDTIPSGRDKKTWKDFIETRRRNRRRNNEALARAMVESLEDTSDSEGEEGDDRVGSPEEGIVEDSHGRNEQDHEDSEGDLTHYQHHLLSLIKNGHKGDETCISLFDELIRGDEDRRLFDQTLGSDDDESDGSEDESEEEDENTIWIDVGDEGSNEMAGDVEMAE